LQQGEQLANKVVAMRFLWPLSLVLHLALLLAQAPALLSQPPSLQLLLRSTTVRHQRQESALKSASWCRTMPH
jgi:hypothetical protein